MALSELLWFLVSLKEETSLLLSVVAKELWIKVSGVEGSGVISPFRNVDVVERSRDESAMVLFPPCLELLRCWGISGCLKLLNLVSIKDIIIKNLPFFRLTLVSLDFALLNLRGTNNFLYPILQFNKHFLDPCIVLSSCNTSVLPNELNLIVIVIIIMLSWGEILSDELHFSLCVLKTLP